ncbi:MULTISPECIES: universal stress protein [Thermodesulfovibrio]|jgi:nucleotide-binding universal stress UspA family protein|uniref:universal stress protein n=1 Tax=Thermodesulfovibrio TaxID=28261 RepID=UPI0026344EB9|nr:universal stress protein [Thermodesulfovibrio sp.]
MFSKILYPTKFDEFALQILKSLICLKSAGLKEVVLLYVIDEEAIYLAKESGLPVDIEQIKGSANEKMKEYLDYLKSNELSVKTKITSGKVVNEIVKEAALENVSLIVTGRHKRQMIDELFIGSTTDGVVKKSPLPVLVVKYHTIRLIEGKVTEQFCPHIFRKILYATDWSEHSERAKKYIPLLYNVGAREIVIVHVIENVGKEGEDERLKNLKQEFEQIGFKAKTYLIHGKPYKEIINVAAEEDISLILMGSHGKGFIKGVLLGSVSQRVLEYSDRSVLIVK